jgi:hypothetical protein
VLLLVTWWPGRAQAQPSAKKSTVALLRIEPLGLEPELVSRLEALFRAELERLEGAPLPSRREVDKVVSGDAALRGCTGEPECLSAIGKKLGVQFMVSGSVGALGDSYVINLKLVEVATGKEVRRVEEPLSGAPDELIDAVRVAAYRLYAPDRLKGSVAVLSDVNGAEVFLDGKRVGKTPLAAPVANLEVRTYKLRIAAKGYTDFIGEVEVRFQKTTQVVVSLQKAKDPGVGPVGPGTGAPLRDAPVPWYGSNWGYVGIGVAAVAVGVIIGFAIANDEIVDCEQNPEACGLQ